MVFNGLLSHNLWLKWHADVSKLETNPKRKIVSKLEQGKRNNKIWESKKMTEFVGN